MATAAPTARLKAQYLEEIRPALIQRFGYRTVMQAPKIEKITLNMGVGDAKQDSNVLEAAQSQLATIAGQRPSVRRARKSIAAFKLREGMPVGVAVTLRGERSYEFLDRLMSIAIPRIRDFRGLSPRSFDGHGNYSMGVREQIIFPEVDYDAIDQVRGLDITITTTARSDPEAFALLEALGMPFAREGRPAGFEGMDDGESAAAAPAEAAATEQEPAVEEPATVEEPAVEEPAAEEPAPEEPAAEEPAEPEGEVAEPETAPAEPEPEPDQPAAEEPAAEGEPTAEPEAEPPPAEVAQEPDPAPSDEQSPQENPANQPPTPESGAGPADQEPQ